MRADGRRRRDYFNILYLEEDAGLEPVVGEDGKNSINECDCGICAF